MTTPDEAVQAAQPTECYLIVKRDLYYLPNSCGYTGIRDEAGRYSLEFVEALCSHKGDGLSFIHESEAPEFRDAAFHDLVIKHLIKQSDEARAALPFLQGGKVKKLEWVKHPGGPHESAKDAFGGLYLVSELGWRQMHSRWNNISGLDNAKAAAQADYEARILSAIEPAPSPRAQALEGVLKIANEELKAWLNCADKYGLCVTSTPSVISHIDDVLAGKTSITLPVERFDNVEPNESIGCFDGSGQWIELGTVSAIRALSSSSPRAQALEDHHDLTTHYNSWRKAMHILEQSSATEEDRLYWKHELNAFDRAIPAAIRALSSQPVAGRCKAYVGEMQTSAGTDYFVMIKSGDRELSIRKHQHKHHADYEAAEYNWLFNGGEKPDILAYHPLPASPGASE